MPRRLDLFHKNLTAIKIYSSAAVLDKFNLVKIYLTKMKVVFSTHYRGNFDLNENSKINFKTQQIDQTRDIIYRQKNVMYCFPCILGKRLVTSNLFETSSLPSLLVFYVITTQMLITQYIKGTVTKSQTRFTNFACVTRNIVIWAQIYIITNNIKT